MSDRRDLDRLVWLRELDGRLGYDRGLEPVSVECAPSWGPVGSLAKQLLSPEEILHIMRLDADIAALERQRRGDPIMQSSLEPAPPPPATPPPVWRREPL